MRLGVYCSNSREELVGGPNNVAADRWSAKDIWGEDLRSIEEEVQKDARQLLFEAMPYLHPQMRSHAVRKGLLKMQMLDCRYST